MYSSNQSTVETYGTVEGSELLDTVQYSYEYEYCLQDLEEQKRTKYKINGTNGASTGTSTRNA